MARVFFFQPKHPPPPIPLLLPRVPLLSQAQAETLTVAADPHGAVVSTAWGPSRTSPVADQDEPLEWSGSDASEAEPATPADVPWLKALSATVGAPPHEGWLGDPERLQRCEAAVRRDLHRRESEAWAKVLHNADVQIREVCQGLEGDGAGPLS